MLTQSDWLLPGPRPGLWSPLPLGTGGDRGRGQLTQGVDMVTQGVNMVTQGVDIWSHRGWVWSRRGWIVDMVTKGIAMVA